MEHNISELIVTLILQLSVILVAAKLAAEVCERYLHQPGVLGELVAGMIIGPYALGGIALPALGALFPAPVGEAGGVASAIPVSPELYALAQIGAIVLLFMVGLETDFQQFFRYGGPAAVIAMGGVIVPFVLGAGATAFLGFAPSMFSPVALFMGAILTATSVGITARVLSDIRKLDTPEGVTVLASAVIDDVLGILVVTVVVSMAATGELAIGELGIVGGKAIGFWLGLTGVGILLSHRISRLLSALKGEGAALAVALAIAFFCAALAEFFGLAMIIGAYSVGLALSRTEMAHTLRRPLAAVYHVLAPIFFAVMGMLVNYEAMGAALAFGVVISVLAIISKVIGCGLPSLALGFNRWGALRIGIGMLPRGEVALIVAGIGLTSGLINQQIFGVAILMTVVTTLLAPMALVPAFLRGGSGLRAVARPDKPALAKDMNDE